MAITDDEALAIKVGGQVSMGRRIFTCTRHEVINGVREPVMFDEKGERLSCILFVTHILHHYTPPPKQEEKPAGEAEKITEKPHSSTEAQTRKDESGVDPNAQANLDL